MAAPAWLPPSQRAAYEHGAERARRDCAAAPIPTSINVARADRASLAWCLTCQGPASRCGCDYADVTVEESDDIELDTVAELIARTRTQLDIYNAEVTPIADAAIAGDRL